METEGPRNYLQKQVKLVTGAPQHLPPQHLTHMLHHTIIIYCTNGNKLSNLQGVMLFQENWQDMRTEQRQRTSVFILEYKSKLWIVSLSNGDFNCWYFRLIKVWDINNCSIRCCSSICCFIEQNSTIYALHTVTLACSLHWDQRSEWSITTTSASKTTNRQYFTSWAEICRLGAADKYQQVN